MDTGQEQNYWPGFVDALSNVVLTLVFVLVIFVFALAMASNKGEEKMRQVTEAENAKTTEETASAAQIVQLQQQLAQAQAELAELKGKSAGESTEQDVGELTQKQTSNVLEDKEIVVEGSENASESYQGATKISDQKGIISVSYANSGSQLDEKAQQELGDRAAQSMTATGAKRILIRSIMGNETYSTAQRVAYYRALNVRNFLMTKLGIGADAITSTVVKPETAGTGRVEIVFQKE